MAKRMLEGPANTKGSALKGSLQIDAVRGVIRVRAWPKKRGKKIAPGTKQYTDWFRDCLNLIKRMEPGFLIFCMRRTKGTNIYPRDLAMQLLAGRGVAFLDAGGVKVFPEAFMTDVSLSLDSLSQTPGAMLIRGEEYWYGLEPGNEADVLTMAGAPGFPAWVPTASGGGFGWWFNPPLLGAFPHVVTVGTATLTQALDDARVGLTVVAKPGAADNLYALLQDAPAYPFTLTAHMYAAPGQTSWAMPGLVMMNSATGVKVVGGAGAGSGAQRFTARRSTGTTFNANVQDRDLHGFGNGLWLRVVAVDATHVTWQVSVTGTVWQDIIANGANTQIAGLDRIGIGISANNATTEVGYLACDHWEITSP